MSKNAHLFLSEEINPLFFVRKFTIISYVFVLENITFDVNKKIV
ncbi:hypothetical protein BMWSH_2219 [Priestia megaterium WSH-002]|uniref:Uncharacterized protein n=1 Tax=Priestia megaterium (strain WSH-002) TaxID=1006007 RepID=A0A8D3WYN2_PRIMW|nr:hypothetical protein BMWSH_2219 [Priestia megaterium WSH-002]